MQQISEIINKPNSQTYFDSLGRGEISQDKANIFIAFAIADSVKDFSPWSYPAKNQTMFQYVTERKMDLRDRDPMLAIKNGEWIQTMVRVRTKNLANYELLMWAGRICEKQEAESKCDILREAVLKHCANYDEYLASDFQDAILVQEKDSEERTRRNK